MNPLLKWLGIVALVLVALFVTATVLIARLVDEAELKVRLVEIANSHLDGTLEIDGDMTLSLLPGLSLGIHDVRLRTPAGASEDFASVRELRLGMDLLPLLRGQVSVDQLVLDGLVVNARRAQDGTANWDSLAGSGNDAPASPASAAAGAAAAPLLLEIDRVRIRNGALSLVDERAGTRHELRDLTLSSDDLNTHGSPFDLEGSARLVQQGEERETMIAFATLAELDRDSGRIALDESRVSIAPLGAAAIEISAPRIEGSLTEQKAHAPELSVDSGPLGARAELALDWSNPEAIGASGRIETQKLDLPALAAALGIALPPAVNPEPLADMSLRGAYALAGDSLQLSALELRAGRFAATGELGLQTGAATRFTARIDSPEVDLDYLFPPPEIPPGNAEEPLPAGVAPAAALAGLDGTLEATLGRLRSGKLELEEVATRLEVNKGRAHVRNLDARLYGGTLKASGTLDGRGDGSLAVKAELAAVDIARLLKATRDIDRMQGRLDGSLDLSASGHTPEGWKSSLTGPVRIAVREPVLADISVEELICKAAAQLNQEALSASFAQSTRFESIDTGLDFAAGVGRLDNFRASVPSMQLRGDGSIDLGRGRLDIQFNTRVTDDLERLDPACRMTRKMLAVEWPISCKGSFDEEPKEWCGIDRDDVAKIAGQLATEKVKDKLMDKLGDFFKRGN